jgi:hypothetical protein
MVERLDTEEVVRRFRKTHGDLYDYSAFSHNALRKEAKVICREHGEFSIPVAWHLRGWHCHHCIKSKFLGLIDGEDRVFSAAEGRTRDRKGRYAGIEILVNGKKFGTITDHPDWKFISPFWPNRDPDEPIMSRTLMQWRKSGFFETNVEIGKKIMRFTIWEAEQILGLKDEIKKYLYSFGEWPKVVPWGRYRKLENIEERGIDVRYFVKSGHEHQYRGKISSKSFNKSDSLWFFDSWPSEFTEYAPKLRTWYETLGNAEAETAQYHIDRALLRGFKSLQLSMWDAIGAYSCMDEIAELVSQHHSPKFKSGFSSEWL